MAKLTARGVQGKNLKPGMHADGGGLYLCVGKGGAKSWIYRGTVKGRQTSKGAPYRVEVGLGAVSLVPLRSSFRDWCSESAHADRELAELALAHTVGNAVERAYARSDLFERRQALMDQWARFCARKEGVLNSKDR